MADGSEERAVNRIFERINAQLRRGDFLTPARVRLWAWAFAAGFAGALIVLVATAHGTGDYAGRPLGTDFSCFYAAGTLAMRDADAAYDFVRLNGAAHDIFGAGAPLYGWFYPPVFLAIAEALAHLPYLAALALWSAAGLALYLAAMRLLLKRYAAQDRLWLLLALAFPAVFVNLTHGQNGFLTAAVFAAALAVLETRPRLAGVLFALSLYKPQFALLIPFALAAGRRWQTLIAAAATVAALSLAATAWYGAGIWDSFFASMRLSRAIVVEQGAPGFEKIVSLFAFVRHVGGAVGLAYLAQGLLAAAVLYATLRLWRIADPARQGAALCLGALLIGPYAVDYDMMLAAPAIALIAAQGQKTGFGAYEKTALALLWLAPIASRLVAGSIYFPLGLASLATVFALNFRKKPAVPI